MIKDLIKSISAREWRFVMFITLFVIILTTCPYFYGWYQTPPGHTYTSLHSVTPGDMHVYFSWIENVKQGNLVIEDLYTAEPQARVMVNIFWSSVGIFASGFGLSNIAAFHTARVLLIPVMMILLYLISSFFWQKEKWRKICFIFLTFASGAGFLISGIISGSVYRKGWYNWPLDLWAPEHNNFMTMFQSPHLIASTVLLVMVIFLIFFALDKNKLKYSISAGIVAMVLFQFHPFHVPTVFLILGTYSLVQFIRQRKIILSYFKNGAVFTLFSAPPIIYWLVLENTNFVTQIRTFQNICLTPDLWVTLFSYGFILILSLIGIFAIIKKGRLKNIHLFLIVWLVVQFALLYSPFNFQRRMMQGLQFPMIILAVFGLYYIYSYLKQKFSAKKFDFWVNNKYLAIILFIIFFGTSHVYNLVREVSLFYNTHPTFYIPNNSVNAMNWLKDNSSPDDAILADLYYGNLIPGIIGHKVFLGHGVETIFFESKFYQIQWLFGNNIVDQKKHNFLLNSHVKYIFFTDELRSIGQYEPSEKDYLEEVFSEGTIKIYRVKDL